MDIRGQNDPSAMFAVLQHNVGDQGISGRVSTHHDSSMPDCVLMDTRTDDTSDYALRGLRVLALHSSGIALEKQYMFQPLQAAKARWNGTSTCYAGPNRPGNTISLWRHPADILCG